ncbi:MAG: DNA polymerase III subunit delta [Sphaerochaeta sp.]|uniref:DNA polymerase III subunit delta n=1 Tax=Sphaerochaeta sp. TaxID=1972642 RepID=UPI003D0B0A6A
MSERAYLLLGPESGAKEQELKEIRNRLRSEYGSEIELSRFYPFETENGEIFAALNNNSLFSDYRLVILSQAESVNASLAQALGDYLAHPVDTATLVIISSEFSVSARIMKQVPRQNTKIFYDLLENQKSEWIRTHFRRMGLSITADAVDTLLDLTEDNTQELKTICNQLGLFWQIGDKNRPIEEDDVQTYVQHSRQEDAFTLFPLLCEGDLKKSLESLNVILGSGDSQTAILLVNGLVWQFRRLLSILEETASGSGEAEAFGKANVQGKASPIRKPKDKTSYHQGIQRYDLQSTRRILTLLAKADREIKESGTELTALLLERLLYQIIKRKGEAFSQADFASL